MSLHKTAIAHIEKLATEIPESSEVLAPLSAAIAADHTLLAGTPTVQECATSSADIADALSATLRAFVESGIELPSDNEGHELTRSVGRILAA